MTDLCLECNIVKTQYLNRICSKCRNTRIHYKPVSCNAGNSGNRKNETLEDTFTCRNCTIVVNSMISKINQSINTPTTLSINLNQLSIKRQEILRSFLRVVADSNSKIHSSIYNETVTDIGTYYFENIFTIKILINMLLDQRFPVRLHVFGTNFDKEIWKNKITHNLFTGEEWM